MKNKVFEKLNCINAYEEKTAPLRNEKNADREGIRSVLLLPLVAVFFFTVPAHYAHAEETYTIKKGDTLWDISNSSNKNPSKWREIWRLNPFITNPNLIFPGETIRLQPLREKPPVNKIIKLKKKKVEKKVVKVKPVPVIPVKESVPQAVTIASAEFKKSGFISSDGYNGSGIILESKQGKLILGKGDEVYISLFDKGKIKAGDKLTIFNIEEEIIHPETKEKMGYRIEILGVLTVTKELEDMSLGVISESYKEIFKGAKLTPYRPPVSRVTLKEGPQKKIEGIILATIENKVPLGRGDVVYIDKGSSDGLYIGNTLNVYRKPKPLNNPLNQKELIPPYIRIGKMVVVEAEERTSTAYIMDSKQEIYKGDKVTTVSK